jgi:hypothetical protein
MSYWYFVIEEITAVSKVLSDFYSLAQKYESNSRHDVPDTSKEGINEKPEVINEPVDIATQQELQQLHFQRLLKQEKERSVQIEKTTTNVPMAGEIDNSEAEKPTHISKVPSQSNSILLGSVSSPVPPPIRSASSKLPDLKNTIVLSEPIPNNTVKENSASVPFSRPISRFFTKMIGVLYEFFI